MCYGDKTLFSFYDYGSYCGVYLTSFFRNEQITSGMFDVFQKKTSVT